MVGVKAQATELGTFNVNGKEKIVCVCKDFTDRNNNLYDIIFSMENEDCNKAILRIVPNIDLESINTFIDKILYVSELQKEFYKTYIMERYNKILLPTYITLNK